MHFWYKVATEEVSEHSLSSIGIIESVGRTLLLEFERKEALDTKAQSNSRPARIVKLVAS